MMKKKEKPKNICFSCESPSKITHCFEINIYKGNYFFCRGCYDTLVNNVAKHKLELENHYTDKLIMWIVNKNDKMKEELSNKIERIKQKFKYDPQEREIQIEKGRKEFIDEKRTSFVKTKLIKAIIVFERNISKSSLIKKIIGRKECIFDRHSWNSFKLFERDARISSGVKYIFYNSEGYLSRRNVKGVERTFHQFIMATEINHIPYSERRDYDVHHINGNKLDNRKVNLIHILKKEHNDLHKKYSNRFFDGIEEFYNRKWVK